MKQKTQQTPNTGNPKFSERLLSWYDQYGRKELPWQQQKTAYQVWISEVMLQQTQVNTVIPYFEKFMSGFPTLNALACSDIEEILHHWSGLGYYSRARNLHKAARIIHHSFDGSFPTCIHDLVKLPGIGRSTAGAILSLANGQHHPILDGNVKRVLSRYFMVEGWSGTSQVIKQLWHYAEQLTPHDRCGDFNQAMMDLGSGVCTRSNPQCGQCPLHQGCKAFQEGMTNRYPQSKPKKALPEKQGLFLMIVTPENKILLEKCPEPGIWGGLWSFPQVQQEDEIDQLLAEYQLIRQGKLIYWPSFKHTFSHFHLQIHPVHITVTAPSMTINMSKRSWFQPTTEITMGIPTPIKRLLLEFSGSTH